jgi:hypothetical protein
VFVADQRTTHPSDSRVRVVAQRGGRSDALGGKGEAGVVQALASRAAFWRDPRQRIQFVDVPKHPSWLNQVEIWFAILVRRVRKRGNFTAVADRRATIRAFRDYFNRTAKPFRWTYTGRPFVS